jgi:asparagine synthase (glutamine-hydrolysing)
MGGEPSRFLTVAERGARAALFSGHLHNRQHLLDSLAGGAACDDAELILRAYERWGAESPRQIRGVFALVIRDGERNVVFAARDRIGVHPLFWANTGSEWLFSSSITALVADPHVSRATHRSAMVDHIRHTWGDHPTETFFEAVRRVPAGHAFEASGDGTREWPYWHVLRHDTVIDWMSDEEAERFDPMLDGAVERCLELGRTAIFLSGGLDSVSIAASAIDLTRRSGRPGPLALSLIFPHPECNEEDVQRGVAAGLGIEQLIYPFDETVQPDGLVGTALSLTRTMSAPLQNPWGPAYYRLRCIARERECPVIMTGNGGDDWLTVNPLHIADLMRVGKFGDVVEILRNHLRSYDLPRVALMRRLLWDYGLRPLIALRLSRTLERTAPGLIDGHRRRRQAEVTPPWLAPDAALQETSRQRFAEVAERIRQRPDPSGPYGFFSWEGPNGFIRPLIAMEFEEQFELSRLTGTLELGPYWDADLVEFLHRIPPKVLDRGGRAKGLVRATIAKRFPKLGFDRQRKVSAANYFVSVLATAGAEAWKRSGGARELARLGVVGPGLDAFAAEAFASGDSAKMHQILDIMHLEEWARSKAA